MTKLFLFDGTGTSPEWWRNFIITEIGDFATIPQIQSALEPYGAKFIVTRKNQNGKLVTDRRYIMFDSEMASSMFLLRWHRGKTDD